MKIKYIITNRGEAIMFTGLLNHNEVANKFGGAKSAGFCHIDMTKEDCVECFGKSVSLGIGVGEEDSEIISRQILNTY